MKSTSTATTLAIALATALVLGTTPTAQADEDKGCSNGTLTGTFGYSVTGSVISPPQFAGLFASVGTQSFDGKGGTSASAIVTVNGTILQVTLKGTYTVNADCTGSFTVSVLPVGITNHVSFVIDDGGREFRAIQTDPGVVVTGVARRQFPAGDSRE